MRLETTCEPHVIPEDLREFEPERDPIESLSKLWMNKGLILKCTAAGLALTVITMALLPNKYSATAVIMPPQQQQSTAAALLGQLAPLAAMGGRDLGLKNPADLYVGILRSRTIGDAVIGKFKLQELYREKDMVSTRETLADKTRIESGKDTLIKVSVEDHDPARAAALANAYIDELYKQNSRLALTEAAQRRLFFERQLETEKNALAAAESALKRTQEQTGVLQVNSQVEAIVKSMAELRAQIVAREVALHRLKAGATPQNPEVIRQETELTALRAQVAKLEASRGQQKPGDPFLPTSRLPQAGLEYIRSMRELKYHETLFELLAKQYEAARIDEAKQAPVIQIVDRAVAPDRKSWPPRALFSLLGGFIAGALACGYIVARERLRAHAFGF